MPDEEEEKPKKRSLLEIAQWAKEQNFHWKSGPNAAQNHNDLFVEAYKESKQLSDSDDELGDETSTVENKTAFC